MEYVALLRGVNVNGITIRSAELKELFAGLGFAAARTFLASGNVRFTADETDRAELKARIERALAERFGYDAWIVLVTLDELRAARDEVPFDTDDSGRHAYVIFCADDGTRRAILQRGAELPRGEDLLRPGPGVVYWSVPVGRSVDSPFSKELARTVWKRATTNRNHRTVTRIAA